MLLSWLAWCMLHRIAQEDPGSAGSLFGSTHFTKSYLSQRGEVCSPIEHGSIRVQYGKLGAFALVPFIVCRGRRAVRRSLWRPWQRYSLPAFSVYLLLSRSLAPTELVLSQDSGLPARLLLLLWPALVSMHPTIQRLLGASAGACQFSSGAWMLFLSGSAPDRRACNESPVPSNSPLSKPSASAPAAPSPDLP